MTSLWIALLKNDQYLCEVIVQNQNSFMISWVDSVEEEEEEEEAKTIAQLDATKVSECAKKKIEQIMQESHYPSTRKAAQDDSQVGKISNKQGNSLNDLPTEVEIFFNNKKGVEVEMEKLQEEGHILIAHKSLSQQEDLSRS
ncbi:hypothetical protein LIER_43694 [Lithospermum erythrorhizon]|uniref:Uncharacterized protein n=1 Tax=Lithospermum erythrorhizon TaxID=34254 RepID=A0AAV3QNT7_LITER